MLGYSTSQNFIRAFKAKEGMTLNSRVKEKKNEIIKKNYRFISRIFAFFKDY